MVFQVFYRLFALPVGVGSPEFRFSLFFFTGSRGQGSGFSLVVFFMGSRGQGSGFSLASRGQSSVFHRLRRPSKALRSQGSGFSLVHGLEGPGFGFFTGVGGPGFRFFTGFGRPNKTSLWHLEGPGFRFFIGLECCSREGWGNESSQDQGSGFSRAGSGGQGSGFSLASGPGSRRVQDSHRRLEGPGFGFFTGLECCSREGWGNSSPRRTRVQVFHGRARGARVQVFHWLRKTQ